MSNLIPWDVFIPWCDFCEHFNNNRSRCSDCEKEYNLQPSSFEEKAYVKAYRGAVSEQQKSEVWDDSIRKKSD